MCSGGARAPSKPLILYPSVVALPLLRFTIRYEFVTAIGTPLCRLCGRLDDLISEPTRAVGATVTAGTVTLIGLPRMVR